MADTIRFDEALPIALLRAREATLSRFRGHVSEHGLTLEQWRVIRALAEHKQLTTASLSELCVLLPPSLSRILKTLEQRGLVKSAVGTDRRTKLTTLTDTGQALFQKMIGKTRDIHQELEELMGKEELSELIKRLTQLREILDGSSNLLDH